MHSNGRQLISGILIALLLAFSVPGTAGAANQPSITLEQAIQIVRLNFAVPAEYSDFSSSFNQSEAGQAWYLSWNKPGRSDGYFSAQVDAASGEIISMNTWKPEPVSASRIPTVSWAQAQQIGTELLERLIPSRMSSLVMIPDPEPSPLTTPGTGTYTINWRRTTNNLPVEGVGAWVTVSAADGQVQAYSLNWSYLPLPDPTGVISPAAAQQSFIKEGLIQLQYVAPDRFVPLADGSRINPLLVYRLDHPSNGAIDAFTGLPVIPEQGIWFSGGGADGMGSKEEAALPQAAPVLTPEEQAELIEIAGLISQDRAAAIIAKWAGAGDGLVLRSASLDQDWRDPQVRIWSLSWSAASSPDFGQPQYLYGQVNARSGELISFNLGLPGDENSSSSLSQTAARQMAENFLRRVQGERFAQFQLDPASLITAPAGKIPSLAQQPAWSFRYIRTVQGISFPDNGAYITVDRSRQVISSYNLTWLYRDLPSAEGIISLAQANQTYIQAAPLTLMYAPYYSAAKGTTQMRLVYQPQIPPAQPTFSMIEAHRGVLLDSQGQSVSPAAPVTLFNDIAGNFAEQEIRLLGKLGLMREYGDAFHPAEDIQLVSLLRAMLGAYTGVDSIAALPDEEIVQRSLQQGWLKEALPPDSNVTRGFLAQLMVRSLGIEYLAGLPEIYRLSYQDAASLEPSLQGYAALCWGLGIIKADGLNFQAGQVVSRAEAAAALVRSLRVTK